MTERPLNETDEPEWLICEGTVDSLRVVYSIRDYKPSTQDKRQFSQLLIARWRFQTSSALFAASEAEWERVSRFEDSLFSFCGVCVAIATTSKEREWRIYAPQTDAFQNEVRKTIETSDEDCISTEFFADENLSLIHI